jgi:hypothetical protein
MLKVPPPAGKSIGPQRKQSTLIFSDGINIYIYCMMYQGQYIDRIKYKIAKKSEIKSERGKVEQRSIPDCTEG